METLREKLTKADIEKMDIHCIHTTSFKNTYDIYKIVNPEEQEFVSQVEFEQLDLFQFFHNNIIDDVDDVDIENTEFTESQILEYIKAEF